MVDLQKIVVKYYYDPFTGSSNSIKYVLPAVINRSEKLREKYSQPIYGSSEIPSLNYSEKVWIQKEGNSFIDPYKLLPPLFDGVDTSDLEQLMTDEELKDGGAALAAYGYLQYAEMSNQERKEIEGALLRYCELDTFAMVMLMEFFVNG